MEPLDRYSPRVVDHVRHPRNAGPLEDAQGTGRAENPACGDVVVVWLRVEAGRVREARFQAEGCPATLAAASALTEALVELPLEAVPDLEPDALVRDLGGLPPGRFHGAELACRAARRAAAEAAGTPEARR